MGRRKWVTPGGTVYHVPNCANGRLRIFKKKDDFAAILAEGIERVDMRICGYCIMCNHLQTRTGSAASVAAPRS